MAATPSLGIAILYVVFFGFGTLIGMALVSIVLAIPFRYCAAAYPQRLNLAHALAGSLSVAVGAWLILEPVVSSAGVGAH